MSKWLNYVIIFIVLAIMAGIGYILWGPSSTSTGKPGGQNTEFNKIHFVHEEKGKKVLEFFAESGDYDIVNRIGKVKNIRVIFFREDGSEWTLTAPSGSLEEKGTKAFLEAPIRGEDKQGASFDAKGKATIFIPEKQVYVEGGVKFVYKDITLVGDKLKADSELNQLTVTGNKAKLRKGGTLE